MLRFDKTLARRLRFAAARLPLLSALALAVAVPAAAATSEFEPSWLDSALGTPKWLTLTGDQRTRYSGIGNQFRTSSRLDENDAIVSLRNRLRAQINYGNLVLFGELQDSRAYLTSRGTALTDSIVDTMELLQGYVGLNLAGVVSKGDALQLKAGRWTQDLGRRRLIARQRFRNNSNNFMGLNAHWTGAGGSELTAFWSLPVDRQPPTSDLDALLDNKIEFDDTHWEQQFSGLWYERPDTFLGGASNLFLFALNEDDGSGSGKQTANRQLYSPGVLLYKKAKPGQWDFDIQSVLQFGTRRATRSAADTKDLDIFAHFHHVEGGYTFDVPYSPRIDLEFDYASGDSNPNDGKYGRFDTLFGARVREFGPTGLWGLLARENIIMPGIRIEFKSPDKRADGRIVYKPAWLAEKADDTPGDGGFQDSNSGSFLGHEIYGRLRYWIVPKAVQLAVYGAVFFNGEVYNNAPAATGNGNPFYGAMDLLFVF